MAQSPDIYVDPRRSDLQRRYREIRAQTEALCQPLAVDDYQIQSIVETSPPKWHLAHVSWFFETFVLRPFAAGYRPFHPRFEYLFNSYYFGVGQMHPRPERGLLSRPTVEEVYAYRAHVDQWMLELADMLPERDWPELESRVTLGLHHEQQHQELLLMDIKHNFYANPLRPGYAPAAPKAANGSAPPMAWIDRPGGRFTLGQGPDGFAYDNERPAHPVHVADHRLASRLVTNGEFLAFMDDGGYRSHEHWLSDGWAMVKRERWQAPLYWERDGGQWRQMGLSGMRALDPGEPVCHVSYYEADAYARWAGARLPSEAELEGMLRERPLQGNFVESGRLHPAVAGKDGQWYGDVWEWSASPYVPYPGFRPRSGAMGEYNGKFMCNQMVLRGGACITPASHMRPSYRNFFYPHDRWAFAGLRLAEDA
jgi:ergothioneine biosynthesis protein EgtB